MLQFGRHAEHNVISLVHLFQEMDVNGISKMWLCTVQVEEESRGKMLGSTILLARKCLAKKTGFEIMWVTGRYT